MQKYSIAKAFLCISISFACWTALATAQTELPAFNAGDNSFGVGSGEQNPVTLQAEFTAAQGDQPARLYITATIQSGWHIYSITQPKGGPLKTEIKLQPSQQFKLLGDFQAYPKPNVGQEEVFPGIDIESHDEKVIWHAPIELAKGINPATLKIEGEVKYQACQAQSCNPPQSIPFTANLGKGAEVPTAELSASNPSATPTAPTTGEQKNFNQHQRGSSSAKVEQLWVQLIWAFVGGFILNFMPCVFPVISLKLLSFMKQAGESRLRVFTLNLWYAAGLLSVFIVLAALAAGAGLSWGEQFTKPWFKVAMTSLVFTMGLSFLGVWEIPIPGFVGSGKAMDLQQQEGLSGAFFKGIFTTILATPCSGPFLGPIFGYLLNKPPYMAYVIFGGVGLGMASPYLLIGAFPKLVGFLPKPGAWMKTFEELMGFLMLATMVYLFTTLTAPYFIPTLTLLIALWFACWLIGRTPITVGPSKRLAVWLAGIGFAVLIGWFAFTILLVQSKIPWQPFSPAALTKARSEGKTVMVDFSAEWCLTCKTNIKFSIDTESVRELIAKDRIVPMLADWTDESPDIKKALNDLGRNSIPVLAIWPANAKDNEVIILSDLISQSQVLDALKKAGPSK